MDPSTSRPAVVIDNGTGYTKMGFAGNVEPSFMVPTVVAVNESFVNQGGRRRLFKRSSSWLTQHNAGVMADLDFYIGEEAMSKSSTHNLKYPIKQGQVENWDAMERFWQHCIFNYLQCDPEDHYFCLTESPLTSPESREYTGEIMFETFNVPGLYIAVKPVLALAAGCNTSKREMTGVVVDIGDGATHVVPVAEGFVIGSSIKSIPVAGKDVTLFIQQLMRERGEQISPEDSFEIARKVKETYCYTSSDIVKEFNKHDNEPSKYIKQWRGIKPKTGAPFSCDIGYERFLGPEIFFNPEIYNSDYKTPLPALIDKCIQSAPIDTRRALYKNIVLSGGSTMFKDFQRRLQRDIKKIVNGRVRASYARSNMEVKAHPVEVNLVSHPIQKYAVWFGGSVLASTPEFYTDYVLSITETNWTELRLGVMDRLAVRKPSMKNMGQAYAEQIPYSKECIDTYLKAKIRHRFSVCGSLLGLVFMYIFAVGYSIHPALPAVGFWLNDVAEWGQLEIWSLIRLFVHLKTAGKYS